MSPKSQRIDREKGDNERMRALLREFSRSRFTSGIIEGRKDSTSIPVDVIPG